MEEIVNARKENLKTIAAQIVTAEKLVLEINLKDTQDETELQELEKAKSRLESLYVLKKLAHTFLKEAESEMHGGRQAVSATPHGLDTELRRLAQQENVLKGMLTRKPASLNFNSTRDDPLNFIEEFGKFLSRECPNDVLIDAFMLL